jgi:glycosyltransferase involved in cell wall biosynthesis
MNVAIVKPDNRAVGGFETVVERLAQGLRERHHTVELVQVDAQASSTSHLGAGISPLQLERFREFFHHLNTVRRFEDVDLSRFDVVLCTQPGSYAVSHPRKVVLFYHHARAFYDLFEALEGVRSHDIALRHLAAFIVRDVDACFLTPQVPILAGSQRVKERLATHNGLQDNVTVFSAGVDEAFLAFEGPVTFETPLCVGRHEFPKRTELFIHAMIHAGGIGRIAGEGSLTRRLRGVAAWLRAVHARDAQHAEPGACPVDDDRLWREHMIHLPLASLEAAEQGTAAAELPVVFLGRVSQADLLREYAAAACVVCPSFDEDYGLTCLEAMACGKPVVACRDGGGYVELIDDGVDGLLVEATGPALADAIGRLRDARLASDMGRHGRAKAQAFTWARAVAQVERALLAAAGRSTE